MRDRIDPDDMDSVIWLQKALTFLLPTPRPMFIGALDYMTWKAIQQYQVLHGLPVAPVASEFEHGKPSAEAVRARPLARVVPRLADQDETLAPLLKHIQQQLKERGLTIS